MLYMCVFSSSKAQTHTYIHSKVIVSISIIIIIVVAELANFCLSNPIAGWIQRNEGKASFSK